MTQTPNLRLAPSRTLMRILQLMVSLTEMVARPRFTPHLIGKVRTLPTKTLREMEHRLRIERSKKTQIKPGLLSSLRSVVPHHLQRKLETLLKILLKEMMAVKFMLILLLPFRMVNRLRLMKTSRLQVSLS